MIDLSIPGQMTELELRAIETLASDAPENARIVEVGSLFGLSSYVWSKSAPPNATVFCIDPWVREPWIAELEATIPGCPEFCREAFDKYTRDCANIVPLRGYSPLDFKDWVEPVDIVFDDAVHSNPAFRKNVKFWLRHLKAGGILCGHDYSEEFPDVYRTVDKLAARLGATVQTVETFWWLINPKSRKHFLHSLF